ncbi:hypothetical protein, partial [Flavobacterium sp.]|uniref:Ig-like domain-containing protein n=1 Tax=Flavobacterium sp. TaxID=239 RepID=UPI0037C07622
MKPINFLCKSLILISALISFQGFSQNLLVNGDFESGSVVGFFSNGAGYTRITPPFSGSTNAGNWALTSNSQLLNTSSFVSSGDHTSGTGFMMVVDGNTTGGQQNFWEAGNAGGGVCGLSIGSTYTFSYWIRSVYGPVSGNPTPAIIGVDILNANSVTLVSGSLTAPPTANGWQQVVFSFRPNGSCVNIKLFNNNTNFDGNDFAIDDISVTAIANNGQLGFCSGSKGDPVFKENFGSGTNYGPQLPAGTTNYTYVGGGWPENGQYTLHYTTNLIPNSQNWHTSLDHTPDNEIDGINGKSLIVNASLSAGDFFKRTVTGLCVNTRFEFSAWVLNIYNSASGGCPGTGIPINISFEIWNDTETVLLQSGNTGNIAGTSTPNWIQYGLVFTTTNQTSVVLKMKNNGVGGCGNDLAIDDIMFRSCGDLTTISSPSVIGTTYTVCQENSPVNITLQANTSGTSNYFYQWQQSSDNINWSDIPGANSTTYITPGITSQRYYRTKVAQALANLNNNFCSTLSDIFTVSFLPSPNPPTSNGNITICANQTITALSVTANANLGVNWYDAATGGNLLLSNSLSYLPTIAGTYYAETFTLSDNCRSATRTPVTLTINQPLSASITCGVTTANSITFNWVPVTGATAYTNSYQINSGPIITLPTLSSLNLTVNSLNPGDQVKITVTPVGSGCYTSATQTCFTTTPCPVPLVSVTQQPSCSDPTGKIVFTSPVNTVLPNLSSLFISQVTDANSGSLTYIEIFNGTGATVNLANYKIKIYNNGNGTVTANCDLVLSGNLLNNDVVVIAVGSVANLGGVLPDLTFDVCGGVNNDDNIRLATIGDVEFDLWGRTDGSAFTPAGAVGYSYSRNVLAPNPSMIWNPADWTATDWISSTVEDYSGVGTYNYQTANYQYSVVSPTYQVSPIFTNLAPNTIYNVTIRDIVGGCTSTPIPLTVNPIPSVAAPTASVTVQPTCTTPKGTIVVTAPTPPTNVTYTVIGTNPVIAAVTQPSATFSNLTPGDYNVTTTNTTTGCISTATPLTVNPIPSVATPTASVTVQPTCTTPAGTIVVTVPIPATNVTYTLTGINPVVAAVTQSSATFSNLAPGVYNVTTTNTTTGCISTVTPLTVNPIPSVAVPTTTIQQPCTILTGAIQVISPLGASLQYSIDGIIFQASPNFTGLVSNNYTITVRNILNGCTNTTAPIAIVNSVNDVIVNINPPPLKDCDPNNDGFVTFDLTQAINSITGGNLGYTVTFHETVVDATIGGTYIPNPLSYDNINPWSQTIFIRVDSNTTSCFEVVPLQLIINPTPIATEPDDYELCDSTGAVGFESFDLTTTNPQILGSLNPLIHAVTFYTNQAAAELGTGNITNPTNYSSNTQIIYVRVENTLTGCYDIVTLQLIVNPPPNSTQPNYAQYSLCDYNQTNIGFETFDLASQVASILLGQTGMDVTFYPSLAEAQSNTNAITNLQYTNAVIYVQTLGIRITNTTTDCYVISTMDIRVEPLPTLTPPAIDIEVCDDNQDGFANFDLASLLPGLLNGITTYSVSFHETLTGAQLGVNAIPTSVPYFSINPFVQTLYVRAEDTITGCFSILPIVLNSDPSPVAPVNLNPITVCDQDSNPQSASTLVNLTQQTAAVLAQQTGAATNYTITYYTSQLLAEQGTAPIIPATSYFGSDLETIWVRVENNNTQCYNVGSFQLQINTPLLLLTIPTPLSLCDDDANPNDQYHAFNLTIKDTQINQGSTATVTYYPSLSDAQNNTNAISTTNALAYVNIPPAVQTLGVVVTTTAGCKSITTLDIRVLPIPTPQTNPPALAPKCDDNLPG